MTERGREREKRWGGKESVDERERKRDSSVLKQHCHVHIMLVLGHTLSMFNVMTPLKQICLPLDGHTPIM